MKVGRTILLNVLSSFLGSIRIFVFPAVHSSSIRGTKVQHTRLFEDMTKYRPSSSTNLQAANNNTARDRLMTSFARGQGSAREMDQPRVGKVGCFWVACSVIMEPVAAFSHTDHDFIQELNQPVASIPGIPCFWGLMYLGYVYSLPNH